MTKHLFYLIAIFAFVSLSSAQTNPAITKFIQNHTGIMGRHYVAGNSTPITDNVLANVQSVDYSNNWVYVTATGIPAYITGPFLDGNPSLATNQNATYKLPLSPTPNTGTPTPTNGGNIGIFINGVSLFDYRDGVAWNNNTNALCGGPGNPMCPGGPLATQMWNRDAIPAERAGFDCAKAHPAMGNYHHHQNPSAFNLDLVVLSNICDAYPADGLYVINTNEHSPLIGFAYDGYPIYGAYGYANADGTGGVARMRSSYQLSTNTTRVNGPAVGGTYFNGYFREDYQYVSHTEPFYLDSHNGRFAVTPEYPQGTYAYYATVDANHNSAYPYVVGPSFYGNKTAVKVNSITETTTNYDSSLATKSFDTAKKLVIYPNPAQDFIAIQSDLSDVSRKLELVDVSGKVLLKSEILPGSTLSILETETLYDGIYFLRVVTSKGGNTYKVLIKK